MIPVDIEALIGKLEANSVTLKTILLFLEARACNGYLQGPDLALNLDIAELVKTKTSQ
jgi:hypothetical protein